MTVTVGETDAGPGPASEGGEAGLPAPVAGLRAELLAAAEAGDHDALAALAPEDFSYSFGGPVDGDLAAYWRRLEQEGEQPLEALAAILRLPYALSGGIYVWPFAHAAAPDELTDYERGLLEELPGGAPVTGEGYLGWRTGIAPDGQWRFFIAGD